LERLSSKKKGLHPFPPTFLKKNSILLCDQNRKKGGCIFDPKNDIKKNRAFFPHRGTQVHHMTGTSKAAWAMGENLPPSTSFFLTFRENGDRFFDVMPAMRGKWDFPAGHGEKKERKLTRWTG